MEVRVEAGDLRQVRIVARNGVDDGDFGRQVQRREMDELPQRVEQRAIDDRRRVMDGTAMDESVRDRLRMQIGSIQRREGGLDCGRMIGKATLAIDGSRSAQQPESSAIEAHALDRALGQPVFACM